MTRVYNFSAGPAALPESILRECAAEMLDYRESGMSVMEMSHRSPEFQAIYDDAVATLRRILNIPEGYDVIFLQGGATLQFAGVPLNLMRNRRAGYIVSGNWSQKAQKEAAKYGEARVVASSEQDGFAHVPEIGPVDQDLDYLYLCQNETVFGTMFSKLPDTGAVPLVADVSSMFLSCPLDVSRYGLIYAGVQKNAGPAGNTVIIVRDDLVGDAPALADICPTYMGYRVESDKGSMLNTPNCWGIYVCGKVFHWVEDTGGLVAMEKRNREKVALLYDLLDQSAFYSSRVEKASRSISNVVFRSPSAELDQAFVAGAADRGIKNVKGHRLVGGMRASCYNAVTREAVEALAAYMQDFERAHESAPAQAARTARDGRSS